MKQIATPLWIASSIALGCLVNLSPTTAQIVPDNTLPVNSSVGVHIDFNDMSLEDASDYTLPSEYIKTTVKPERDNNRRDVRRILVEVW